MRFLIDMDGPVADFEAGVYQRVNNVLAGVLAGVPAIHPSQRIGFYAEQQYRDLYGDEVAAAVQRIVEQPKFFAALPVQWGALKSVTRLMVLGHDVRFCTSPLSSNPTCLQDKYDWVRTTLGKSFADRNLIITKDKTLIHGDYLVDDKPRVEGSHEPTWQHVLFKVREGDDIDTTASVVVTSWQEFWDDPAINHGGRHGI